MSLAEARDRARHGIVEHRVLHGEDADAAQALLTDPQTSGGLLVACAPDTLDEVLAVFGHHGFERAAVIGQIAAAGGKPRLTVG